MYAYKHISIHMYKLTIRTLEDPGEGYSPTYMGALGILEMQSLIQIYAL